MAAMPQVDGLFAVNEPSIGPISSTIPLLVNQIEQEKMHSLRGGALYYDGAGDGFNDSRGVLLVHESSSSLHMCACARVCVRASCLSVCASFVLLRAC
jgi:hypothetical protein